MYHLNTTTVLLLHKDRVKDLQKMYETPPLFRGWKFWRKSERVQATDPCNALREIPQGR
jgi:hypothetical protein